MERGHIWKQWEGGFGHEVVAGRYEESERNGAGMRGGGRASRVKGDAGLVFDTPSERDG